MKRLQRFLALMSLVVLVTACGGGNKHNEASADDLVEQYAGKRIGVLLGSAQEDFGRKHFTKSVIETFGDASTAIAALQAHKLDAALVNSDASRLAMERNNTLVFIKQDIASTGLGFAFKKGNEKLRKQFNDFLREMQAAGELDTLYDQWDNHFDTAVMPADGDGSAGTLLFGTTGMDRPFSTVRNNELVGYDVALAYRFAAKYGYRLKVERLDFGGLIPGIVTGKLDLIGNSIQINETRAQNVDFSDAYFSQSCDLIGIRGSVPVAADAQPGSDGKIRTRADMAGKRIAVVPAMLYDEIARKQFPNSERVYTELATLPVALTTGKCDAILMERTTIPRIQAAHPQIVTAIRDIENQQLAFGFNKKETKLLGQFNDFLNGLKASGELKTILDSWINHFDTTPMTVLTGDGSGGTLRFGTTCEDAPVSGIRNGQPAGHNIDLVYRFANRHNMKVELLKMNFTGMITAIEVGRCNIIGDNVAITEERSKRIAFSVPFMEEPIDLVALKKNVPDEAEVTAAPQAQPAAQSGTVSTDGKFRSAADLANARFGIMTGSVYDPLIRKHFPNAKRIYLDRAADVTVALMAGKCDAMMVEHSLAVPLVKENPKIGILVEGFEEQDMGFAFNLKSTALEQQFSAFIRELKASGEMATLLAGWEANFATMPMPKLTGDGSGGTLRFGSSLEGAPASAVRHGEPAGSNVDIVYRFANKFNMKVQLMPLPFTAMLASVETGKCDIIGDNISVSEERKKRMLFSEPYAADPIDILVMREDMVSAAPATQSNKMRTAADLNGRRIGLLMGAVYEAYAKEHYPQAQLIYIDNKPDIVLSLENGKCDGAFFSSDVIPNILQQHPDLAVLEEKLEVHHVGFGVRKGNTKLLNQLNEFIAKEQASGELPRLNQEWMNKPYELPVPQVGGDGSAGVLRVGTTGVDVPASFVRDGKLAGTDIAIIYLFATQYNYKVQIEKTPFGGLIAALTSGKIDVIASNLVINDERKKTIDMSNAYGSRDINMLARKADMAAFDGIAGLPLKARLDLLKDKRIGMVTGDEAEGFFKQNYPDADYSFFNTVTDLAVALNNNKVDAGVAWRTVTPALLNANPNLALYADEVYNMEYAFCFNKKDAALCDSLTATIQRLRASGELDKIRSGWMSHWESMPLPRLTGDGSGGTIVVGATMTDVPCSFIKEGQPAGMDVDIIYRYASAHNLKVEFRKFDFGGMLQALSTGKADMLCGEIAVTPERKKQYLFSDGYQNSATTVLVTKAFMQSEESAAAAAQVDEEPGFWENLKTSFENNLVQEKRYMLIINGLWVTLIISVLSALLGTLFGAGICFLRMNRHPLLNGIAKGYITVVRGTPILVLLMIMYYVIFAKVNINAIPVAVFAFAMNFAAYVSEMFRTSIESIPGGQTEAGIAMGFTKVKTFIYIILPQAVRRVLPVYKGEFISLVKTTSIVGYIAVEDLTKASDIIRSRTFDAFFPLILVAIIYFFIAWVFTLLLDRLDAGTDPKRKLSKKKQS